MERCYLVQAQKCFAMEFKSIDIIRMGGQTVVEGYSRPTGDQSSAVTLVANIGDRPARHQIIESRGFRLCKVAAARDEARQPC